MAPFPWGPGSHLVADWLHSTPSIIQEAPTIFIGIDAYSEYGFAFSACSASASSTMWTHRMSDSSPWYSTQYCFQQSNSVYPEGSVVMGSSSWNLLVLSSVPLPRNTWLDRMEKFPAEGSVMAPQPESLGYCPTESSTCFKPVASIS